MIDTHLHAVAPRLPGDDHDDPLWAGPVAARADRLRAALDAAGVTIALGMGHCGASPDDPLGIADTVAIAALVPRLRAIGILDPARHDDDHFARVEEQLASGRVCALKAYLGYHHHGPEAPEYAPYYRLAARYTLPVIFHTGDTYSRRAKVKFAHPLRVDEVAVDHPDVNFVLAHVGNPWLTDAAEVIYKNDNVWADLSGLLVGDESEFDAWASDGTLDAVAERVRDAYDYTERPDRFLFGSDWPLAPLHAYRDFVRRIVPEEDWPAVSEANARALFRLG